MALLRRRGLCAKVLGLEIGIILDLHYPISHQAQYKQALPVSVAVGIFDNIQPRHPTVDAIVFEARKKGRKFG